MLTSADLELAWLSLERPQSKLETSFADLNVETQYGSVCVGLDSDGARILMVPNRGGDVEDHVIASGLAIAEQGRLVGGRETSFADLYCNKSELHSVFSEFAADLARRFADQKGETELDEPFDVIMACVREWRGLLGSAPAVEKPKQAIIGLRGELEMLRILARNSSAQALPNWRGPTGSTFDFQHGRQRLEVKTTTAQQGSEVTIHGLQQLDPVEESQLYISLVRLQEDPAGETILDVVQSLIDAGVDREELYGLLARVEFHEQQAELWPGAYRIVGPPQVWFVDEGFPGLRLSEVDARGIRNVEYQLELDSGGLPLPDAARDELFAEFVNG